MLKTRYGSEKRIIRAHVRALLDLKSPNIRSASSRRSFVDGVNSHMRGLDALHVASNNYEIFLCEILLSVVPQTLKHEWAKLDESKMDLSALLTIIENEAKHQEIITTTKPEPTFNNKASFSTPSSNS